MRKLIAMLSTLITTSAITPLTIVCNENKINEDKDKSDNSTNSEEIEGETKLTYSAKTENKFAINKKNKSDIPDHTVWDIVLKWWLQDDCLKIFGKLYRLEAIKFRFITWKEIIKDFELFLYEEYGTKFKIEVNDLKENEYLTDIQELKQIKISFFEINAKWKILTSDFHLHIHLNDTFKRFLSFQLFFKLKWEKVNENPKNLKDFIDCLNKNSGKFFPNLKNVKFILEDFFSDQSYQSINDDAKVKNCRFLANFIYMKLTSDSCSMPICLLNSRSEFMNIREDEFWIFNKINDFMIYNDCHINVKSKLVKFKKLAIYTYQDFADYLNMECWNYTVSCVEHAKPCYTNEISWKNRFLAISRETLLIKLSENQDKVFTDGKNILKLLVLKDEEQKEYIEYHFPIYWYDEYKVLQNHDFLLYEKFIIDEFNYPNSIMIGSSELKEGQPRQSAYNLILKEIKNHDYGETELFNILTIEIIKPDKLLEKGHNIINVNIKASDFKFQVDFHIIVT